jgi:hypothetical protein
LCLNAKPDRCFAASALGEDFHLGRGDPTFTPGLKIGRSSFIVLPGHSAPGRVLMVSRGLCQTGETEAVEASLWRDSRDRLTPTALRPGSVRVRACKCSLRSNVRPRWIRRLPGWPLRSRCDGESRACGCWRTCVDGDGSGDEGGYAIHHSLDRTDLPIVGT